MKTKELDAHYFDPEHHSAHTKRNIESSFPSRSARKRQQAGVKGSSFKNLIKKPAAIVAAMALLLTGLVALFQPAPAQADEWKFAGKPGTAQGYVFTDKAGDVEDFNKVLGDTPIPGVLMNAMVVKSDGTVIAKRNEKRRPVPFQVRTDANGYYSFNFKPEMEKACEPNCKGDDVKLAIHDRIRIWPDESNYKAGHPLAGKTPKRLNGGTRLTPIETLTLAWLGMVNYHHGSMSNVNMSFRDETQYATNFGDKDKGNHLPKDQWKPTLKHDMPASGSPLLNPTFSKDQPYLCGHVYSDVTYRFDRWDNGGNTNANAAPDKVVPGVRVVVTTYKQDLLGRVTDQFVTRYDYTDNNGAWCVKFDSMAEVNNIASQDAKFMVTIDSPKDKTEADRDKAALKAATGSSAYDDVAFRSTTLGMPEGFASVGANGWHGTIRPMGSLTDFRGVGYLSGDVSCSTRGQYCLPDLIWVQWFLKSIGGAGADLGLIPAETQADYSRYSQEYGVAKTVKATVKNAIFPSNKYRIVMVATGADPTDKNNWFAESGVFKGVTAAGKDVDIEVPATVPVGDYSFFLYSSDDQKVDPKTLHDVDPYRVTDTIGHYYTEETARDAAIDALHKNQAPSESVDAVAPGTEIFGAYQDMGEDTHKVVLANRGTKTEVAVLDSELVSSEIKSGENAEGKVWDPYTGKDSWTIANTTEPGDYDLLVYNHYGDLVDRKPLTVTGPKMTLEPPVIQPGGTTTVHLKDLNPNTEYQLIFTPASGAAEGSVTVDVPAGSNKADVSLKVKEGAEYKGLGEVKLVKKASPGTAVTKAPLNVSTTKVYGPEIILPGFQDVTKGLEGVIGPNAGDGRMKCDVQGEKSCLDRFGVPAGTRYYRGNHQSGMSMNIYALKPFLEKDSATGQLKKKIIRGGPLGDATWKIDKLEYRYDDASLHPFPKDKTPKWSDEKDSVFQLLGGTGSAFGGHNRTVTVTMTVTDDDGLSDTKSFVLWTATGAQNYYGTDWESIAAVLNVGDVIPEGQFCMKFNGTDGQPSSFKPSEKMNDTYPWPEGVTIDSNGCLTGKPLKSTPNDGDMVDVFAMADFGKGYLCDQISVSLTKKCEYWTPPTIRIAVRNKPDTTPPTLSAKSGATALADGETIKLEQGDNLNLVYTGEDETALESVEIVSGNMPNGVNKPLGVLDNNDPHKTGTVTFADAKIADDASLGTFPIKVRAVDVAGNATELTINVEVVKKVVPPVFDAGDPAPGKQGKVYSWDIPVIDPDGNGPGAEGPVKSVDVTSGALPKGLQITPQKDGSFKITGTPTEKGSFNFTLTATDKDGNVTTHDYVLTVAEGAKPEWPAGNKELTFEVGKAIDNTEIKATSSDPDCTEITYTVDSTQPVNENDPVPPLPDGLVYDNGVLSGTPTTINTPDGADYKFTATCGAVPVEKIVKITIKDTTKPEIDKVSGAQFKVGSTVDLPLKATDNSGELKLWEEGAVTCTPKSGTTGTVELTLAADRDSENKPINTAKVTSVALSDANIGEYECTVKVKDSSSNTNELTFPLSIIPDVPILIVEPATQTVKTLGQATEITPITVSAEEGATLNVDDCKAKLPSTIEWDKDGRVFSGTVNDLTDKTYTCDITATDTNGKVNTKTVTINVDGPVSTQLGRDDQGNFIVDGRVGRAMNHEALTLDKDCKLAGGDLRDVLGQKFANGDLDFADGKITGTPTASTYTGDTPGSVVVTMKGTCDVPEGTPTQFDVPVKVTIVPETRVDDIPATATQGQKFKPVLKHGEEGKTYTVKICAESDPECTNPLVSGKPGDFLVIPDNAAGGKYNVKVVDNAGNPVNANTKTLTVQELGLVKNTAGNDSLPTSVQGGTAIDTKLVNPNVGSTYTVKLCKVSDPTCKSPIATKEGITSTKPEVGKMTLPVIGSTSADTNNEYVFKVFKDGGTEPLLTSDPITATAGSFDSAKSTVEVTQNNQAADGTAADTVKVTLKDNLGNPITGQADNLALSGLDSTTQAATVTEVTGQPGVYQIAVTSTQAGTFENLQVTLSKGTGKPSNVGVKQSLTFVAGAATAAQSTIAVEVNNQVADGKTADKVKVTFKDANGNIAAKPDGFAIALDSDLKGAAIDGGTKNADGTYTFKITSPRPGTTKVSAKIGDDAVSASPVEVTFTAGTPDAARSTVTIDAGPKPANNTDAFTITVKLKDATRRVMPGMAASIAKTVAPAPGVTLGEVSESATEPGTYTFTMKSTKTGEKTVSVTANGVALNQKPKGTFIPGALDTTKSTATVSTGYKLADGKEAHTLSVTLVDINGNPVTGLTSASDFGLADGTPDGVTYGAPVADPKKPGTYTIPVKSTSAGDKSITPTVKGTTLNTATAMFADRPTKPAIDTANQDGVSGTTTGVPAGSTVTITYPKADGTADETCTQTVTTDDKGNFSLKPWPADCKPKDDTYVRAVVTNKTTGIDSEPGKKVIDITAPAAPTINPTDGTAISGTVTDPTDTPEVVVSVGDKSVTVPVDKKGNWKLTEDQMKELSPDGSGTLGHDTEITAKAKDKAGNLSDPATQKVDAVAPDAPQLKGPSDGKTVTGTAEPGSKVTVTYTDNDGKTQTATGTTKDDGTFEVPLSPVAKDGSRITATATDAAGNTSKDSDPITVDSSQPTPVLNNLGTDQTATGTAEPGSKVKVYNQKGDLIGEGTADTDGNFSIKIPDNKMPGDGEKITATSTDGLGNVSKPAKAVTDLTNPDAPKIKPTNGSQITGTTSTKPGKQAAKVQVTIGEGKDAKTITVEVGTDGHWSVDNDQIKKLTGKDQLPDGTKITAVAIDSAKNKSEPAEATVDGTTTLTVDKTEIPALADPADPSSGNHPISGTGESGATVTITSEDGKVVGTAQVGDDGKWSITPKTKLPDGNYTVTSKDKAGNTGGPLTVKVDGTAPKAPKVPAENDGKTVVVSDGEPGSTIVITNSKGEEVGSAVVETDGTATVTLDDDKVTNGETLTVVAKDDMGNTSSKKTTKVNTQAPPIDIDPTDGKTITGVTKPGLTVTVTGPDGDTRTAVADENGKWTITDGPWNTPENHRKQITAKVTDPVNNKSSETSQDLLTKPIETPTVDKSNGSAITGTGEPGTTITVTDKNGKVIGETVVDENGKWTVIPDQKLTEEQGPVTATATDNPNFREPKKATGVVDTTPPAFTVPPVNNGKSITVTDLSPDTKELTVTDSKGNIVPGTVTKNPDGSWTWTPTDPDGLKDGETYDISATDDVGNTSPTQKTVVDKTPPGSLTVDSVDGKINGTDPITGTTEPGAKVVITYTPEGEDTPVTVEGKADENGNFQIPLPSDKPAANGSTITVDAVDSAGNSTADNGKTVTVTVDRTKPAKPSIAMDPKDKEHKKVIVSKVPAGTTPSVTLPDGTVLTKFTKEGDNYVFVAPTPIEENKTVTAKVTNGLGIDSDPASLITDYTAPKDPTIVVDKDKPDEITGTTEPGATVTVCVTSTDPATGKAETKCQDVVADDDGNYTVPLDKPLNTGDTVTATAKDDAGNTSEKVDRTIDFTDPQAPTVDNASGNKVTGKTDPAEAGGTVTVTDENGDVIGKGEVKDDGTFEVTYGEGKEPDDGDKVYVTVTDKDGNESNATEATVDASAPGRPTIDPTQGKKGDKVKVTVTEDGGTVEVTYTDDETGETKTVTVDGPFTDNGDGTFTAEVELPTTAKEGDDIIATHTDALGNTSEPAVTKADRTTNPPIFDKGRGDSFTGTAEPGATVTITYTGTDGAEHIVKVTVGDDGKFDTGVLEVPAAQGSYHAIAKDKAGNTAKGSALVIRGDVPVTVDPTSGKQVSIHIDPEKVTEMQKGTVTVTYEDADGVEHTLSVPGTAFDGDGNLLVTLEPAGAHGTQVKVEVSDDYGNTGSMTVRVDSVAPDQPKIDSSTQDGLSGKSDITEAGGTVTVTDEQGNVIGTGGIQEDGSFVVTYEEGNKPAPGSKVIVTVTDAAGNTSDPLVVKVDELPKVDPEKPGKPAEPAKPGDKDKAPTKISLSKTGTGASLLIALALTMLAAGGSLVNARRRQS